MGGACSFATYSRQQGQRVINEGDAKSGTTPAQKKKEKEKKRDSYTYPCEKEGMAQSGDIDLGQWAFATERSAYRCEGISFDCTPPNACVRDLYTLRPYCCDYDGACWTYQATCSKAGDDSSAADAQNQQCVNNNGDGDGEVTWCCENGR